MFALLALAGDIGCSLGPGMVGVVSNSVASRSGSLSNLLFGNLTGTEAGLKTGLLCAILFPVLMFFAVSVLSRLRRPQDPKNQPHRG